MFMFSELSPWKKLWKSGSSNLRFQRPFKLWSTKTAGCTGHMGEWYQKHWAFPGLSVCRMEWPDGMGCPSVYRLRWWRIWFQSNLDQYLVTSLDINRKLMCKNSSSLIAWIVFWCCKWRRCRTDLLPWRLCLFAYSSTYLTDSCSILRPIALNMILIRSKLQVWIHLMGWSPPPSINCKSRIYMNPICILNM